MNPESPTTQIARARAALLEEARDVARAWAHRAEGMHEMAQANLKSAQGAFERALQVYSAAMLADDAERAVKRVMKASNLSEAAARAMIKGDTK